MEAKIIILQPRWTPDFYRLNPYGKETLLLFTGTVRAGFPSPASDYNAEPLDLNSYVSQNPTSTFLVKVEGDSMIGAHIEPGDLAVVDRSKKAESGKIVLAYVDGEFTIKRLLLKPDSAYLVPENPNFSSIKIDNPDSGRIWGVVVGIVKTL